MNQSPPAQPAHPADVPEPDMPDPRATTPPAAERTDAEQERVEQQGNREAQADQGPTNGEKRAADAAPSPAPRPPAMPPPLPIFGGPQQPPRYAAPPLRPPGPPAQPQPPMEQPPYPPRIAAPQPAPPGGMAEPPRPYEGGRYVPPPPAPPAGPPVPGRDWAPANTTIMPQPAPQPVAQRGNPLITPLLGVIAVLLLALAVFQGITTFHPKAASPTGIQQVQVQKLAIKPTTAAEVKDTITNAQTALNQLNQKVQDAYAGATTDAQRQAVLLQSLILLQQIIAQQNNDLLLIYQDLNT